MYCDGSITIMWSLNISINYFTLPCRRVKKRFVEQSESVLYLVWNSYNFHLMLIATLFYSKFEIIQLQR